MGKNEICKKIKIYKKKEKDILKFVVDFLGNII